MIFEDKPDDVPNLPEGWVYAGVGSSLPMGHPCLHWTTGASIVNWRGGYCGQNPWDHYAAHVESDVGRVLLFEQERRRTRRDVQEWEDGSTGVSDA